MTTTGNLLANREPILVLLAGILQPLGDKAGEILAWIDKETKERPILSYVHTKNGRTYELGQADPMAPDEAPRTVFAMILWDSHPLMPVVVYTYGTGTDDQGREWVAFYRGIVFPEELTGPVSHEALYKDLRAFLTGREDGEGDGDEPDEPTNGARGRH